MAADLHGPGAADRTPEPVATVTVRRSPFGRWRLPVSLSIVGVYLVVAIVGPMVIRYDGRRVSLPDRFLPPGARTADGSLALLGTDQVGRDVFAQVVEGARISMTVGAATLVLAGIIGITLGVAAGYFGGALDSVIMRLADVQLAFPSILLAILIAAVLGPSVTNVILTLAITKWVVFARVARAQALTTRERDFIDASRTLGANSWHVIRRCIVPSCITPLMIVATVELGLVVIAEASLSFLGLGTPSTSPSWGLTVANGRDHLADAWWISTMPGIALALLVVSVGSVGDELRDRFDPNLKGL